MLFLLVLGDRGLGSSVSLSTYSSSVTCSYVVAYIKLQYLEGHRFTVMCELQSQTNLLFFLLVLLHNYFLLSSKICLSLLCSAMYLPFTIVFIYIYITSRHSGVLNEGTDRYVYTCRSWYMKLYT